MVDEIISQEHSKKLWRLVFFAILSRHVHNGRDKTVPPRPGEPREQGGVRGASGRVVRRVSAHTPGREGGGAWPPPSPTYKLTERHGNARKKAAKKKTWGMI